MSLPIKRSVAVLIRSEEHILSTRRPDNDEELPGVWGLPAGSYRGTESLEELVRRIGQEKLGVLLIPIRKLAQGMQIRERYTLDMELWEAEMSGTPKHSAWRWAVAQTPHNGESQGSLCCRLALEAVKSGAVHPPESDADQRRT